jgi:aspartate 1-decarboxylase
VYISLLKSKIHRAVITEADLNYEGSLSISADLAELVELEEYERILVGNISNGERFETYVIYAVRNHGTIALNGAIQQKRELIGPRLLFWARETRFFARSSPYRRGI